MPKSAPGDSDHGGDSGGLARLGRILRYVKRESPLTAITGLIALVLGLRDLFHLHGPGWAKALAWFAAGITGFAVVALYYEQARHRREVATLTRAQRREIRRLDKKHRAELDRYARNARVAAALPSIHQAFHDLRDAAF